MINFPKMPKKDSLFIELKDKENVVGCIQGEFHCFYEIWKDNQKISTLSEEAGDMYENGNGEKKSWKFKINFIKKDDMSKVFILQGGTMICEKLHNLKRAGYELDKTWVCISRVGVKFNTKYEVLPSPNHSIAATDLTAIKEMKLHNVAIDVQEMVNEAMSAPPEGPGLTEDDIPF